MCILAVEGNGFGLRFYYYYYYYLWKAKLIKLRHPQIDQFMKLNYCEFKAPRFKHYTEGSSSQNRSSKH